MAVAPAFRKKASPGLGGRDHCFADEDVPGPHSNSQASCACDGLTPAPTLTPAECVECGNSPCSMRLKFCFRTCPLACPLQASKRSRGEVVAYAPHRLQKRRGGPAEVEATSRAWPRACSRLSSTAAVGVGVHGTCLHWEWRLGGDGAFERHPAPWNRASHG